LGIGDQAGLAPWYYYGARSCRAEQPAPNIQSGLAYRNPGRLDIQAIRLVKLRQIIAVVAFSTILLSGCVSVKPWQRAWLEDADMVLETDPNARYEQSFHGYREGAAGATGAKAGGGCGCQ
jgi:hypothetical protein